MPRSRNDFLFVHLVAIPPRRPIVKQIIGGIQARISQHRFTAEEILNHLDDSDFDISDTEEEDSSDETFNADDDLDSDEHDNSDSNDDDDDEEEQGEENTEKKQIKWYTKPFQAGNTTWRGDFDLGAPLETPAKYFFKYFKPEIFTTFAEQTNIYYLQSKGTEIATTESEMRKFFGATILMANLRFPRIRMYWQYMTRVDRIANVMPVNRYFLLRTNLHINAAREPDAGNTNKFWKVKPVLDAVRNRCVELPREEYCAVDEQMIPFTGRVPTKQVIKSKPNPVGIKNFVLCGKSGRALDFEFYQGKGTGIPQETKHLGLGASVVILLTNTIPRQMNYKICFDNYFTGIPLIRELKSKGILSVGNRLMNI
ncbi:uncharacterized protein LOC117113820 [Anneissia japonica]|uniref:uncharacterized protein LOC117113820 n=1 Tax=Anneissia japonica TaxID=1529436 RepID=UPI0014258E50|nr:uncharacterized protein LOC117113820 [Anneissia japonica]